MNGFVHQDLENVLYLHPETSSCKCGALRFDEDMYTNTGEPLCYDCLLEKLSELNDAGEDMLKYGAIGKCDICFRWILDGEEFTGEDYEVWHDRCYEEVVS
jgi:hypothetical protein